jgi:eukaryotic-like serine/threonine-protein kinase
MIGTSLSHYRITEKLGQGGMGEVYRAKDTNLSRQVAIKVLPDEFAHDAERLARFEREAKLLASLNHPNIAAIHGLEEHEGKRFLVLELVEGQTLAERLHKGALPVEEALEVCRQIAEGLEAAHEKGIIHRDLKPPNVKITPEGKVKILDFGLAKAFYQQAPPVDPSRSPTITEQMTAPGVILGTAAYMSPEQARGRPVDKRADIWAFGCVLYECLTGKRAFQGETITETVAAILKSEPDWTLLPVDTPPFVRAVLRQCLRKDPSERLHDISDARIEMRESVSQPWEATTFPRRWSPRWSLAWAVLAPMAGAFIAVALLWYFRSAPSLAILRSVIKLNPGQWLDGGRGLFERPTLPAMSVSSDGKFIVYSAIEGKPGPEAKPRLYTRRLDQMEARPITGTEGGISQFLSPDDQWVGFWAEGKLKKVPIEGGVPVTLCDVEQPFGASWGRNNRIIFFSPAPSVGLSSVSVDGGTPEVLTRPDQTKEEGSHRLPHCLPDGKTVLFTILKHQYAVDPRTALLDLSTLRWQVLLENSADAQYAKSGHIVFLRSGTMMAVPFELSTLKMLGQPVPVISDMMQGLNSESVNTAAGQYSISDSGALVFAPGGLSPAPERSLVWVDQKGKAEPAVSFKALFAFPRLSPDGRRIAYKIDGPEPQIWVYDINRGTQYLLTDEGRGHFASWTPDGRRVLFGSSRKSADYGLSWRLADGSAPSEKLIQTSIPYPGAFTPDGGIFVFAEAHKDTGWDLMTLQMQDRHTAPLLSSKYIEMSPALSPDGRWLAYSSDESGRAEIYVQPFPGLESKFLISHQGGGDPRWARNGKQLFYQSGDQMWAVEVRTDNGFSSGKPRLLFEKPGYGWGWDFSVDGQRFLMVKLEEAKPSPVTEMILVQNWFEELKRLCPTGKN